MKPSPIGSSSSGSLELAVTSSGHASVSSEPPHPATNSHPSNDTRQRIDSPLPHADVRDKMRRGPGSTQCRDRASSCCWRVGLPAIAAATTTATGAAATATATASATTVAIATATATATTTAAAATIFCLVHA